jgi:two-component system, chemotaxis family, chemotaxis protein CheY
LVYELANVLDGKRMRILIADDAQFVREILGTLVKKAGHELVGEVENGDQALDMALKTKPDLVIMDIVMPIKSGIQATIEILQALPETKVIACSTVDQDVMLMKALEAGAVEYVRKPFHALEVLDVLARVEKGVTR